MLFSGHLNTVCTVYVLSVISVIRLPHWNLKITQDLLSNNSYFHSRVVRYHYNCQFASVLLTKDKNITTHISQVWIIH